MPIETIRDALVQAKAFGFLGPGSIDAHIDGAEAFAAALRPFDGHGLDLGTGAGVPGLVLAQAFPASSWVLLDASSRKTSVLSAVVAELGLADRVEVVRGRAEELAHEPTHRFYYDAATARSFGRPAETAELAVAFLRPGGLLIVAEPPAADEDRWVAAARLGLTRTGDVHSRGVHVAVFTRSGDVGAAVPRPVRKIRTDPAS